MKTWTAISTCLFILTSCCACQRQSKASLLSRISVSGKYLVDKEGRTRIFHGFNAVQKGPPWYPEELLNVSRLQLYKSWGFTAVRLGAMWSGVMPQRGVINQTYLDVLGQIVDSLGKHGMYVILDMHQDVLSSRYGSYDGAPLWLIDSLPPPSHPFPWPLKNITAWAEGYIAEATGRGFQAIYDDVANARSYYVKFWETVASYFKSKPSVLGYELINEPWAGDIYSDPSLLLPGTAGSKNLMPLYDIVNKAVRPIDNDTLIFYEPVTWGVVLQGKTVGSGFQKVPGGDAYKEKSVLSYHYYCWFLEVDGSSAIKHPSSAIGRQVCDDLLGPVVFQTVNQDIKTTGGGSFLTEFGECDPDGNPNSTATVECNFVMTLADKNLQSWTYWDSGFFDGQGNINWNIVKAFARPYARGIAGTPSVTSFDPKTKSFQVKYIYSSVVKGPTEIVVPTVQYPKGFDVHLTSGFKWVYVKDEFVIKVLPDGNVLDGTTVTVSLTSK